MLIIHTQLVGTRMRCGFPGSSTADLSWLEQMPRPEYLRHLRSKETILNSVCWTTGHGYGTVLQDNKAIHRSGGGRAYSILSLLLLLIHRILK